MTDKLLHDTWKMYHVLKSFGLTPPLHICTAVSIASRRARKAVRSIPGAVHRSGGFRSTNLTAEILAAVDHLHACAGARNPSEFAAPILIDERLSEARRYAATFRSLAEDGDSDLDLPPSWVRADLKDLQRHMPSKIDPLCVVAELLFRNDGFRQRYAVLEKDLVTRTRKVARLKQGRRQACRAVRGDFVTALESWCKEYEAMLLGQP